MLTPAVTELQRGSTHHAGSLLPLAVMPGALAAQPVPTPPVVASAPRLS